jgi:hypothetical protein
VRCTVDAVDGQARAFSGFDAGAFITVPPMKALATAGTICVDVTVMARTPNKMPDNLFIFNSIA